VGTKLLISNLPRHVDASALEDMFTVVGDVRAARIECDAITGASNGVGYVEMSSSQQAQDGIQHFNGQSSRGHVLAVREDKPHTPKELPPVKIRKRLLLNSKRKSR
jgi:RNA recognition motif-containing protein